MTQFNSNTSFVSGWKGTHKILNAFNLNKWISIQPFNKIMDKYIHVVAFSVRLKTIEI